MFILITFLVTVLGAKNNNSISDPPPPDYSVVANWAALPNIVDFADLLPDTTLVNGEDTARTDVFFIHPTTFTSKNKRVWNADVNDRELNKKTDETTIKHQASVFNGSCRVYAPRYRQANIKVYYHKGRKHAEEALDLAYSDVKAAFEYYLAHYNQGRPIIIASHSQGSTHARRLLKEFFDGKPLSQQLVVAYMAGMPITKANFTHILPCNNPGQTGCFNTWNTWVWGSKQKKYYQNAIATNPLNWTIDGTYAPATLNRGGVLGKFNGIVPQLTDAQSYKGILWVHKPNIKGKLLFLIKNYHIADFNLFYMNIRQNAAYRIEQFLQHR